MKALQHIEQEYKGQVAAGCGTSLSGFEQQLLIAHAEPFYSLWRAKAALSVAHMLETYDLLGVNLPLESIKGETWYAGIPSITQAEVDWAKTIKDKDVDNWIEIMPSYLKTFKGLDIETGTVTPVASPVGTEILPNLAAAVVSDLVAMGLAVPLPKKAEKKAETEAGHKEGDRPS